MVNTAFNGVNDMETQVRMTYRMFGSHSLYLIDRVAENGQATYSKIFKDGKVIEMCNPMHIANFKPLDDKSAWKDKTGRTATEAAQDWKVGEFAIMTILGDFYVKVTGIEGSEVIGEVGSQRKEFTATMDLDGLWMWKEKGRTFYPLRHDDGRFHEYDD
jgi:hypothetical protein